MVVHLLLAIEIIGDCRTYQNIGELGRFLRAEAPITNGNYVGLLLAAHDHGASQVSFDRLGRSDLGTRSRWHQRLQEDVATMQKIGSQVSVELRVAVKIAFVEHQTL